MLRHTTLGNPFVVQMGCFILKPLKLFFMKNIRLFLVVLFVTVLVVIILISNMLNTSNQVSDKALELVAPMTSVSPPLPPSEHEANNERLSDISPNDFEAELIAKLQANYQARIGELTVQASLINVKKHVLNLYPSDGEEIFKRIIHAAFPSHATAILMLIERLETYNLWLIDNQLMLSELPAKARDGAVWIKRRELFGKDADVLWSADVEKSAQKQIKMHEIFQDLNDTNETTLDEKLYQLQEIINEHVADSLQELAVNPGMLSQAFFNFDSVQNTLKVLPPEDRQLEINRVRRQLGYDEEMIAQLQEKDSDKNKRWENGLSYMQARQTLEETMSGEALESALSKLRQEHFKNEASTIEKEEKTDFFRFERRRVFGRN
jgi:hypothetical protein